MNVVMKCFLIGVMCAFTVSANAQTITDEQIRSELRELKQANALMTKAIMRLESRLAGKTVPSSDVDIQTNDALAQATLRSIATAAEMFAVDHQGQYPTSIKDLTDADIPYLDQTFCGEKISGYAYSCAFSKIAYEFIATPVQPSVTGSREFKIKTGARFVR